MSDYVYMRPPFGEGEVQKIEATPEALVPLLVSGWSQCDPPAHPEEVTDVHD